MYPNGSNPPTNGGYSGGRPPGPPPSPGGFPNTAPPPSNLSINKPAYAPPGADNKFKSPSAMVSSFGSAPPPASRSVSAGNPSYGNQPPSYGAAPAQQPPPSFAPYTGSYGAPNRPLPPPPSQPQQAPSYTTHAPPPLASVSFSGTGPDSSRSNRNSGTYQSYNTGAPQMKLFNNISPGQNMNNTSSNNLSAYGTGAYGDINNPNPISPTSGLRRNESRIDPSQMPRPDRPVMDVVFHTKSGAGRRNPPSVNSLYTTIDTGNCAPRLMRTSLVAPPTTKAIHDKVGLPFALIATPFAPSEQGEPPVPVVDIGPLPPRCTRCNGYVNSSVIWGDNGNVWTCNLCSMINDTPPWYYCSLDGAGLRMDRACRPELTLGAVDYLVSEDYCIRPIQEPIYVFAIDISQKAVANGVTIAAIRAVRTALSTLRQQESQFPPYNPHSEPNNTTSAAAYAASGVKHTHSAHTSKSKAKPPPYIRAAIVTYDHAVQFYTVNMQSPDPIKMYVCNSDEPLCPLPHTHWLYGVTEHEYALEHLLQRIPELIASMQEGFSGTGDSYGASTGFTPVATPTSRGTRSRPVSGAYDSVNVSNGGGESPCCVAAAIKAIQEGLASVGGRVCVVSSSHATVGYGALSKGRERINLYGTRDEINLYGYASTVIQGIPLSVKDTAVSALSSAATAISATAGSASSSHAHKLALQQQEMIADMQRICTVYKELSTDCARTAVCVTVLACVGDDVHDGGAFFDTQLLGEVTTATGGQLHFLTGSLVLEDNVARLTQQLVCDLDSIHAAEAVVKVRTSVGLRVDKVLAPGVYNSVKSEVELCGMDSYTTLMFALAYDSALKEDERVHFQLAVLYTTLSRRRMIRVLNLSAIATHKPTIVFRNCDIETVIVALLKEGVDKALSYPLAEDSIGARYYLDNAVADALHKYRVHCSPSSPKGQLVLPDSIKVMPVYTLAMLKHPAIMENRSALGTVSANAASCPTQSLLTNNNSTSEGNNLSKLAFIPSYGSALSKIAVRAHERAYELRRLLGASVVEVINSLYPRMYNISSLFDDLDTASGEIQGSMSSDEYIRQAASTDYAHGSYSNNNSMSNDSIDIDEPNTSTGSVSFNNLLGRSAVGLQLAHPNTLTNITTHHSGNGGIAAYNSPIMTAAGVKPELSHTQQSTQLALFTNKLLNTVAPTAEVFEGDQIYLLDDRTSFYMYVGRAVPAGAIDDIMITTPGTGGLGRREYVSFKLTSELGRRINAFLELLRSTNAHKQELKVVWSELASNNPLNGKFSARLIEDSNAGLMSYVDYLCNMHIKIQAKTS